VSLVSGKCESCGFEALTSSQTAGTKRLIEIACSRCNATLAKCAVDWVSLWHSPLPARKKYPGRDLA
jgi:hypothetical protein